MQTGRKKIKQGSKYLKLPKKKQKKKQRNMKATITFK